MTLFFRVLIFSSVLVTGCDHNSDTLVVPGPAGDSLRIVEAFPSLDFNRPVDLQNHGDDNLFIVEQRGVIQVFRNDPTTDNTNIFLDIQSVVDDRDNEEGLLGLAFHPNFSQDGYFYVNYTTIQGTTRISRFELDAQNPTVADSGSELVLLEFAQPFGNHNGGQLVFGPDGYLYIAVGDGGNLGDPLGHAQNRTNLLGTILRIDVNRASGNLNYGIPADNPFVGNQSGYKEEIFAYGLRNPWRMSFDTASDLLWVGDVGENDYEEIDIIEKGGNYGWKIMEAFACFVDSNCDQSGLISPYYVYPHLSIPASITGGTVYRGSLPTLAGWYLYSDYVTGNIFALETGSSSPKNRLLFRTNHRITTFGTDHLQELYFCSLSGKVYKISGK